MSHLPKRANRLDHLPPYGFAIIGQRILDMTAAGKDVIRLDIGSPDLPPPDPVIEELKQSASNPHHYQYGSYRGDPAFRAAVADYYKRRFDVDLHPFHEVLPLLGSKEGLVNLALAYIDRGDAAIIPDIGYPAYMMGTIMAGGSVIEMPLDPDNGYLPNFDGIKGDISQAKLLWINYPNNPTGAVADLAFYEQAVAFCRDHNLLLCSDNPYCEVVFDGYKAPSVLEVPGAKDCTVEFMSLSKTYNMAGCRIGACVGNREALNHLLNVKSNIDSGHWKAMYDAATYAINTTPQSWIDERNMRYRTRKQRILDVLPQIGLEAFASPASLYVWARVLEGNDESYVSRALEEAQVALTPGTLYGQAGAGWVRISLSVPEERLDAALARLREWYHVRVA